jgi:Na+-translocating ferredoxin:NAD+ oxidoreductase RnfD subunit
MKKIFAFGLGTLLLTAPVFSFADSSIQIGQTPLQILTTLAAVEAQVTAIQNDQTLSCAILSSATSTKVDQQVLLAWGSVGAVEQTTDTLNMRPLNGGMTLLFAKPGTWKYSFAFYDMTGASTTCSVKITAVK